MKNTWLERLRVLSSLVAVVAWFGYGDMPKSWGPQNHPSVVETATGHVIPYHSFAGLIFVTQPEIDAAHRFLGVALAASALALACGYADHKLAKNKER